MFLFISTIREELESTQSKLLKAALGLKKYCRNTELLNGLKIQKIFKTKTMSQLDTLKLCLNSNSSGNLFYCNKLGNIICGSNTDEHNLAYRSRRICRDNSISLLSYISDDQYAKTTKRNLLRIPQSGISDTVIYLLSSPTIDNMNLVNMLLSPF